MTTAWASLRGLCCLPSFSLRRSSIPHRGRYPTFRPPNRHVLYLKARTPEEIALMERSVAITRAGHEAVARATVAGVSERDVQTQLESAFFGAGATGLSYGSIVGRAICRRPPRPRCARPATSTSSSTASAISSDSTSTTPASTKRRCPPAQ